MHDRLKMMKYLVNLFELNFYKKIEEAYKDCSEKIDSLSLPEKIFNFESSNTLANINYQQERNSQMPIKLNLDLLQSEYIDVESHFKKGGFVLSYIKFFQMKSKKL